MTMITSLEYPSFLMSFPFTLSNRFPNNLYMKVNSDTYDLKKAWDQWIALYSRLSSEGIVYLLPAKGNFQDLPFVANIGAVLPHLKNTILVSNFKSWPRRGEEMLAWPFFESLGYRVFQPPFSWEGEADLKWIRHNIYVAPYGQRTELEAHRWMEKLFDMEVISIFIGDSHFFHLDCLFFPFSSTKALVGTLALQNEDIKKLEKIVDIIPVPHEHLYDAWTNSVRIGNKVYNSHKSDKPFEDLMAKYNLEVECFDLSEFEKSGADLSCLVMFLRRGF
jgi:N-dimethylarginine dimethylaminohydrolase